MGESPSLEDNAAEAKSYAGQQALFAEVMQEIANDLKDKELPGSKTEEENKNEDEGILTKQGDVSIKEANKEKETAPDAKEKGSTYRGRESILWFQNLEKGQTRESCLANIDLTTLVVCSCHALSSNFCNCRKRGQCSTKRLKRIRCRRQRIRCRCMKKRNRIAAVVKRRIPCHSQE